MSEHSAVAPSRLVALDVTRAVAILGMMAVHIGGRNLTEPTGPWQVLHHAAGFSAGTFAVVAGVALSLTNPMPGQGAPPHQLNRRSWRDWAPTVLRGLTLFVMGLLVESVSGGVLVILCVYGALFVVAAPLRDLSARALVTLGVVLMLVWPVLSLAIRRRLQSPPRLEVSWEVLRLPDAPQSLARILFLDGTYPVPTWLSLALVAWGAHRAGWLGPARRGRLTALAGLLLAVGFGGAAIVERIWHPRQRVVEDLVAAGRTESGATALADNAFGVPPSQLWVSLLTAGRHSGTTFELVQILAVASTLFLLAAALHAVLPGAATVLSWPGRIPLTLYVVHLVLLWAVGGFWLHGEDSAWPAFWAVMVFWALSFGFAALLRDVRGPLEELVRRVAHLPGRRSDAPAGAV